MTVLNSPEANSAATPAGEPPAARAETKNKPTPGNGEGEKLLQLPAPAAEVDHAALAALKTFCALGQGEGGEPVGPGLLPVLLEPYADPQKVRTDYPLLLFANAEEGAPTCAPLAEVLQETVNGFAPGEDQSRVLKDNLPRIERSVLKALATVTRPLPASEVVGQAARALPQELQLTGEHAKTLVADVETLVAALPTQAQVLGLGAHTEFHLLLHAVRCHLEPRRAAFDKELRRLIDGLKSLLRIEKEKSAEGRQAAALNKALGPGVLDFVDTVALSEVLGPQRGSEAMPAARRQQIEQIVAKLTTWGQEKHPWATVYHDGAISDEWVDEGLGLRPLQKASPCEEASTRFDEQANAFAEFFGAVRVARLELAQNYDPARHDPWLAAFDWRSFSQQELLLLPPVVVFCQGDNLLKTDLQSFGKLLLSGRPVVVVTAVHPLRNLGTEASAALAGYRFEVGYFGLSLKEAFVAQATAARPVHLAESCAQALRSTRPALQVLSLGTTADNSAPALGPWLYGSAALEGRAYPLFRYDPEQGTSWARCLDFAGNPAVDQDWSRQEVACKSAANDPQTLELAFTFADVALLDPAFADCFRVVPAACEGSEDLVTVDAFFDLPGNQAAQSVPFVWATDKERNLRRVAVSRQILTVCHERLHFWRTLQEFAGVRSEHVDAAVAQAKAEIEAAANAKIEQLQAEQTLELERVRNETAAEAMERLAAVLLELDQGAVALPAGAVPAPAPAPAAGVPAAAAEPEEAPAVEATEEEEVSFDEPWIDSALCTSCNDCINLNQLLFKYNSDKQAQIADLSKGTYAQLVQAAEKCPGRCIHPGKPQNPDEPNLDELIKRAAPFN